MALAFEGIRVLELGQIYNGPYCGLLLAQLGADVIKVEPPRGEPLRFRSHLPVETHEFVMRNSNKRSIVLDLKTDEGRDSLLALVGTADVLLENFAPGTMERLGLAPARLLDRNPRLIVASGKGYGSTGPYAQMSAMDITVQAMSGSASVTGDPDRPPTKSGAAFVDFSGGIHLFGAISAALFQRERTGRGQIVEVSMHDTIYPMLASSLGGLHNDPTRQLPERTGNRHSGMAVAPYNIYEASDGWLAIICIAERHWHGVAKALGRGDLIDDPRFATERDRVVNIDAIDAEVTACTRHRTRADLVAALTEAGVPCAPVKSIREVDTDEHLIHRGMIQYVEHPARGRVPVAGCPLRMSDSPVGALRPAPSLGASSAEVLSELLDRKNAPMPSLLEPATPLATYYDETAPQVGTLLARRSLGTLDASTISRYAMTIGARDPIHFDRDAARAAGHVDVVAPPNLLAAVVEWGAGTPEADLGPDGTPTDGEVPLGADLRLRVMGAGEEMELVNPAAAGTEVVLETTLDAVTPKQTRSGPCVFVTTRHTFLAADGTVLNRNRRTIVLRDPLEGP
jgi:crotonobetainyl-CoA:carnitine CoA-transferase CaiB-like acyl-CoA transferase/acyl dehydratase